MHILISNDDGYSSQGIKLLNNELSTLVNTTVVAPTRNRSAASNSLTVDRPLRVNHIEGNTYAVDGTPTDCVHLAVTGLLEKNPPDMVVSGINDGQNLGDDVLYSGTVAAATEGRFLGFPALAFSLVTNGRPQHWESAARIARLIVEQQIEKPLSTKIVFNINIPDIPFDDIAGIEATRLGSRHRAEPVIRDKDPQGKDIFWVGSAGPEQDAGPGTDFYAINRKFVSITPLHVDFTHYESLDGIANWIKRLKV